MMYDNLIKQLRYCADALTCRNCLWKTECCPTDMQKNAADAIEELQKQLDVAYSNGYKRGVDDAAEVDLVKKMSYWWIPVTERLPEDGSLLGKLVCDSDGKIRIASQHATIELKNKTVHTDLADLTELLAKETPSTEWDDCTHITHWMPLPEAPKGGE